MRAEGIEVKVLAGRTPRAAIEQCREAIDDGVDLVAASGGDGLAHLALQAVADATAAGNAVTLGVVPAGTGNDLARLLDVPVGDPLAAAGILTSGRTRTLDLIRTIGVRTAWVATVVALGFDARVAHRVAGWRRPHGALSYRIGVLAELATFRPLSYRLAIDELEMDLDAMLLAVGNGPSYGSGMRICPAADPADGQLDLTVVRKVSRLKLLQVFPTVYTGDHVKLPQVATFRAARIQVSGPKLQGYGDGESVGPLPLTLEVRSAAVRVAALPSVADQKG